ncbi:MAG: cytochrome C [candidate division Zixibacteria bacterium]|nr:cytochrome C [candidate division Zixibacteria bacterium]
MSDKAKIITGLIIFLIIFFFPVWYNLVGGTPGHKPEIKLVIDDEDILCPTDYMRSSHMDLLNDWRDEVVRDGERVYVAFDGRKFNKSLSQTCMNCHPNKADFCDQCHNYIGVDPYCWDCHIEPEEDR